MTARVLPWALAALWLAAGVLGLTRIPPMHADEAWLASETRAILVAGSAAASADFFHVSERRPHAIRLLFHALQAPFVAASFSLASVRTLSLLCGAAALLLAGVVGRVRFRSPAAIVLFVGGLAADPMVTAASHLGRPEIVLVLFMMAAFAVRARRPVTGYWNEVLVGSIVGLSIGVHANSLLVALAVGSLGLLDVLVGPRPLLALRRLCVLVSVTAMWALAWVGWSRFLSPDFPRAYVEFGGRYGVTESLLVKLLKLPSFYGRLFHGIAGTYYLPEMRPFLILVAVGSVSGLVLVLARVARGRPPGAAAEPLAVMLAVNVGLVLIGKYSQPTAVLLAPAGYWLAACLAEALAIQAPEPGEAGRARGRIAWAAAASGVVALAAVTVSGALPWASVSYARYLGRVLEQVPAGENVLGPLNAAFAFDPGRLHAYNDLDSLGEAGLSLEQYVERFGIRWIVYPEEMDLIYRERPVWNDLYGNVAPYYADLGRFLLERCVEVARFEEPVFAMRIVPYQNKRPASVTVWRVLSGES